MKRKKRTTPTTSVNVRCCRRAMLGFAGGGRQVLSRVRWTEEMVVFGRNADQSVQ